MKRREVQAQRQGGEGGCRQGVRRQWGRREASIEVENVELVEYWAMLSLAAMRCTRSMQFVFGRAGAVGRDLAVMSVKGKMPLMWAEREQLKARRELGSEVALP